MVKILFWQCLQNQLRKSANFFIQQSLWSIKIVAGCFSSFWNERRVNDNWPKPETWTIVWYTSTVFSTFQIFQSFNAATTNIMKHKSYVKFKNNSPSTFSVKHYWSLSEQKELLNITSVTSHLTELRFLFKHSPSLCYLLVAGSP